MITPDGRLLYVVHQASDDVFGYRIEADGDLTQVVRLSPGELLEGAAISPDGRLLYLNSFGGVPSVDGTPDPTRPSKVHGFRIGGDGRLTPVLELPLPDPHRHHPLIDGATTCGTGRLGPWNPTSQLAGPWSDDRSRSTRSVLPSAPSAGAGRCRLRPGRRRCRVR